MKQVFLDYMNGSAMSFTKIGASGETTFSLTVNRWFSYGAIVLVGLAILL